MQAKALLFSFLLSFFTLCNFAQTSASANNIAIQGIARDAGGNAKTGVPISLKFEIYYLENNITRKEVYKSLESVELITDNFGVFSYILNPGVDNNAKIANNQVYLQIEEGGVIISDEKLNHVPYAIAANNGVPTGSIMPFIGAEADVPEGWVFCDGRPLPSYATKLIAMVGANAPDLQGTFLRGTGTSAVNGQDGPALMATQSDGFEAHLHDSGTLENSTNGSHQHNIWQAGGAFDTSGNGVNSNNNHNGNVANVPIRPNGNHSHTISGSTAETGDLETRPVNYGVNYIIKL